MKTLNLAGISVLIALAVLFSGCSSNGEGVVNGSVSITGYVHGVNVSSYKIEISKADDRQNWRTIGIFPINSTDSDAAVRGAVLADWNTSQADDGRYVVRLTAADSNGLNSSDYIYLTVENNLEKAACPVWSCSNLREGNNKVNVSLTREQYGNNMNCTAKCSCRQGLYALVYSNGSMEQDYDFVHYVGIPTDSADSIENYNEYYERTGNWTSQELMSFDTDENINIKLSTDYSNSGSAGYGGFDVPSITCTRSCISVPYPTNEYIAKVRLGNATTVSGNGTYSDYTQSTFSDLNAGQNYTLEVDVRSTADHDLIAYAAAWIDYNGDRVFESEQNPQDDSSYSGVYATENDSSSDNQETTPSPEFLDLGPQTVHKGVYTFSKTFTVPKNVSGGRVRMRISLKEYDSSIACLGAKELCDDYYRVTSPGPCEAEIYGEVEDYTVNLKQNACTLAGDLEPCGQITLSEVVSLISKWSSGEASLGEVMDLISAWSAMT